MEEMTLRVPVAVKAKVTDDLKAKIVSDLETRLDMVNKDLEAIEFQAQRIWLMQLKLMLQVLLLFVNKSTKKKINAWLSKKK